MKKLVLIALLGLCSLVFAENDLTDADQSTISFTPFNEKQVECLAKNMYFEAKNQPEEGIRAVGYVTLNRVADERFPKSICDVVYQRVGRTCQFSWVCGRGKNPKISNKMQYNRIRELALEVASTFYVIDQVDPTRGSLFFHATHVNPKWNLRRTVRIGEHIFYSRKRNNDRRR